MPKKKTNRRQEPDFPFEHLGESLSEKESREAAEILAKQSEKTPKSTRSRPTDHKK
jgi:hypothetical protein